jgi:hypothetical protein
MKIYSSPVDRCIHTVSVLNNTVNIDPNLFYNFNKPFYNKSLEIEEIKKFINDNEDAIKNLEKTFDIDLSHPISIYDLHSSLHCYNELNYNVDNNLLKIVDDLACHIYNIYYKHYNINHNNHEEFLKYILEFPSTYNVFCTHDTMVFGLAKYLQKLNKNDYNISLPIYCSNIRIEEYDDEKIRIFYNNHYIGSLL